MASNYICLFCQRNMRTTDPFVSGACDHCGVTRGYRRYVLTLTYRGREFEFIWDMIDQQFILQEDSHTVLRADFDINITPQNALKKLPTLITFS